MSKIHVFIPHRWKYDVEDYRTISALLDRSRFEHSDYSVPNDDPFPSIDGRYNVDPQIKEQIKHATFVVCSNRPANKNGIAIEEIKYAVSIGKPVVSIQISNNTSNEILTLGIQIIHNRKDSLENWVEENT